MTDADIVETLIGTFVRRWVLDVVSQRVAGKLVSTFTIWCAGCDAHISPKSDSKSWAATQARQVGWKEKRHEGWLCPECSKPKAKIHPKPVFGEKPTKARDQ